MCWTALHCAKTKALLLSFFFPTGSADQYYTARREITALKRKLHTVTHQITQDTKLPRKMQNASSMHGSNRAQPQH